MLTMRIGDTLFQWDGEQWNGGAFASDDFADTLTEAMQVAQTTGGDPYPDLTRAKQVAEWMKGTITDEGTPPPFDPNVVY